MEQPYENEGMRTREEFLAVYQNQRSNTNDVRVDDSLIQYKDLLDQVVAILEQEEIIKAVAYVNIDFGNQTQIEAKVSMSPDKGILLKMTVSIEEEVIYYGIKMGYEKENFFVRELLENIGNNSYDYFEFLENNHLVNARYNSVDYWYQYKNQNDNTFYSISNSSEGKTLSWFNPETMVRTMLDEVEGHVNYYELFNEKGIIFSYIENLDTNQISVAWQLLEATGWDKAYATDFSSQNRAIYRDDTLLFEGAKKNVSLNINFANIRVELEMTKADFTDSILNLSAYGLDFHHPELSVELINSKIANAMEESSELSVYNGVDFLSDDLDTELYQVIDDHIKPDD